MIGFSKKEIRVFSTVYGYFIGEIKSENENMFYLKDPGQVQVLPNRDSNQPLPTFIITEIIPPFLMNKDAVSIEFPLKKIDVLFSGPVVKDFAKRYEEYVTKLIKNRSGIQLVSENILHKIQAKTLKPFQQ